jgi:PAS domain S-box-containing protein
MPSTPTGKRPTVRAQSSHWGRTLARRFQVLVKPSMSLGVRQRTDELERSNAQMELARDLAFLTAGAKTVDDALHLALRKICESTGWTLGQAWVVSASESHLHCSSAWHAGSGNLEPFRKASEGMTFEPGVGLPGQAWSTSKPAWISDVRSDPSFPRAQFAAQVGLGAGMAVPVMAHDEVVAVMEFFLFEEREEDVWLVGLVSTVAAQLGSLIQRKQAEEGLRASEERFRAVTETAKDAIVSTNSSGQITYFNSAAEHAFGYSARELIGKPFTLLMPERLRDGHRAGMKRFLSTGEVRVNGKTVELTARRKHGAEFPIELSLSSWASGADRFFTAIVRDITRRKTTEAELRRLAAIIESSDDAIVGKTLDGTVITWNSGAERLYGYSSEEMIGEPVWRLAPADRKDEVLEMLERVRRGESVDQWETLRRRKDGTSIALSSNVSPIKEVGGEVVAACTIARDVTERKRAEEALKASDLMKTTLLRAASHDFRSPLTAIAAAGGTIAFPNLSPERRQELASIITEEADRLSRLVANLLDLSRLQGGEAVPNRVSCPIEEVVDAALTEISGEGQMFEVSADPELPSVWADPAQLERAFANLLDNARRFADDQPVEVRVRADEGRVVVRVADRGPGVAENDRERIFEPFQQGAGERRHEVSGLGLAIVKGFVEVNGGRVFAESLPRGQGAAFVVELPLDSHRPAAPLAARQ